MYETPEEMQAVIEKYFEECNGYVLYDKDGNQVFDKFGKPVIMDRVPPTVTGLALALGFTSRQALLNYQAKKEFVDTVTRAKARCESYAERRLYDRDGNRGAEFSLKCNFKWNESSGGIADERQDDNLWNAIAKAAKK